MTKFDNVQISHRRGRKVADDYGVDDVKLPAGGLEVDEDGWLRVAQADNVGVCGGQSAARLGELDPPCVFFELERADGSDVGVICVEVCNVEAAPKCTRAFIDRCEELKPFDPHTGSGGYVGATVSFDGIAAAHVGAVSPSVKTSGVHNAIADKNLNVERMGEETRVFTASHRSSAASIVASLDLTDGSFALMFGSEPTWDARARQALGRVHGASDGSSESERVADALKKTAAAAILNSSNDDGKNGDGAGVDPTNLIRVRTCGSVLDDVGGRAFGANLQSSMRSVREALDRITERFESRETTRSRIVAESEAAQCKVEDALRVGLNSHKRKEMAGDPSAGDGGIHGRKKPVAAMGGQWDTLGDLPSDSSDSEEE